MRGELAGDAAAHTDFPLQRASRSFGREVARPLLLALVSAVVVGFPVLPVFASFVDAPASADTLRHLASTVIPAALVETAILTLGVLVGVVGLGASAGWLTAGCDFPGRKAFEWALLLPLAMPAYIVAYAYTDALQFSGPV